MKWGDCERLSSLLSAKRLLKNSSPGILFTLVWPLIPASRVMLMTMKVIFFNLSFIYSEKVADGSVSIRKQSIIRLNSRQGKIVE